MRCNGGVDGGVFGGGDAGDYGCNGEGYGGGGGGDRHPGRCARDGSDTSNEAEQLLPAMRFPFCEVAAVGATVLPVDRAGPEAAARGTLASCLAQVRVTPEPVANSTTVVGVPLLSPHRLAATRRVTRVNVLCSCRLPPALRL